MVENVVNWISMNVSQIHANMEVSVVMDLTLTRANVCQAIPERIARLISTTVKVIPVAIEDLALIWSMDTNVSAASPILDEIVSQKWTHAYLIDVEMEQNVRRHQTISIFRVHATLAILADYVMKILTNVLFHRPAATVLHVKIQMAHITAFVPRAMKAMTVPSTRMTVLPIHVKMAEHVLTKSVIIHVCVLMASKENTVRLISMSVYQTLAKMVLRVINT